jgi:hypothetical protein
MTILTVMCFALGGAADRHRSDSPAPGILGTEHPPPLLAGVPLSLPVGLSVSPEGRLLPVATDQVNGPVPPVAVSVVE